MPDLPASTPLEGATARHGSVFLSVLPADPIHWIAPWPGRADALSGVLEAALGIGLPGPGETMRAAGAEIRWAGRDQALLLGASPPDLAARAAVDGAVTDVSDVYARLMLSDRGAAAAVLARLVPLDLREQRFPAGATARSLLGHIAAQVTATETGIEIMVMRSFAHSAFHEIEIAMEGVAGRDALG